jgi:hypothetical protein
MTPLREARLTKAVHLLSQKYKDEILTERDWWWGFRFYTINIHDYGTEDTGWFTVNIYKVEPSTGMDNYSESYDLEPLRLY